MSYLDRTKIDRAFVPLGTPMFADLIHQLQDAEDVSPTRRRDLISGLRRVAKALGRDPKDVPADPKWLQPRIAKVMPAALNLSQKTWTNAVSDAKSAMTQVGLVVRHQNQIEDLALHWRILWRSVLDAQDPTLQPALCRFVHFLDRHGISPEVVSDEHALAFREALALNEIGKSPDTAYRAAVNGWNLARRRLHAWPQQTLTLPDRTNRIALPLACFPQSFQDELGQYCRRLAAPDLLAEEGTTTALADATIGLYRNRLLRFASVLVHAGIPIEDITTLRVLVDPANAETGLRWLLSRNEGQTSRGIDTMAALLAQMGREHAKVSLEAQARLDTMATRLRQRPQRGMTARNRERLRGVESRAVLRKLLLLPDALNARVAAAPWTYQTALMSEDAIAIALFLQCPVRRKNLGQIDLERNLHRPGDGRVYLVFEEREVKNRQRIEFELQPALAKMIDTHIARRSPLLCPAGTQWLFPKRDGSDHMNLSQFSARVKQRLAKDIGITFNVHLFRHLAAKVFLDANPGSYEVVRQLLGHASLSKTLAAYAGFEAGTATRLFADVMDRARTA